MDAFGGDDVDEEPFMPDFLEVDKIISCSVTEAAYRSPDPAISSQALFLVKWCSLPHSECTWEMVTDIRDDDAIEAFWKRERLPPKVR